MLQRSLSSGDPQGLTALADFSAMTIFRLCHWRWPWFQMKNPKWIVQRWAWPILVHLCCIFEQSLALSTFATFERSSRRPSTPGPWRQSRCYGWTTGCVSLGWLSKKWRFHQSTWEFYHWTKGSSSNMVTYPILLGLGRYHLKIPRCRVNNQGIQDVIFCDIL